MKIGKIHSSGIHMEQRYLEKEYLVLKNRKKKKKRSKKNIPNTCLMVTRQNIFCPPSAEST